MRGRRLFTVGNSVAREFHFHTLSNFCGKQRVGLHEIEKALCKGERGICSERCAAPLDEEVNASFSYIFQNRMGSPLPPGYRYHDPDACPDSPELCMEQALNASRPGDALVFFMGLSLAWEFKHMTRENMDVEPPPGAGFGEPEPREYPIFDAVVRRAAHSWRNIVQRSWKGRAEDVFRIRVAPLCLDGCKDYSYPRAFHAMTSSAVDRVNGVLDHEYAGEPWHVIDQWGINSAMNPGSSALPHHRDFVHYEGEPNDVTFDLVLSGMCDANAAAGPPAALAAR
jgi:hypothetical protein